MELTTVFVFAQVGDGYYGNMHDRPFALAGLSSGVVMVALGQVRRVCDCCVTDVCEGAGLLLI